MSKENMTLEQLILERKRLDAAIKVATTARRRELVKQHLQEIAKAGLADAPAATLRGILRAGQAALGRGPVPGRIACTRSTV